MNTKLVNRAGTFFLLTLLLVGRLLATGPNLVQAQTTPQPTAQPFPATAQPSAQQVASFKDYTKATEDKKFLLVMLAPDGGQTDPALRQKYPKAGLYPNNGSTTAVWTTDWDTWYQNLPDSQLYTTADGKYLARLDRSTDLALAFYVIGIEVKRYGLYELVPTLVNAKNPADRPNWVDKAELDSIQRRFVVETTTDDRLEFDTTTGQRLPGFGKPDSVALIVGFIAIVVISVPIAVIAYIGIRRQIRFSRARKKDSD